MTVDICAVTIPKWGIEMQEGTVAYWHVAAEQKISKGDDLIDIETDKIVNTMEAPVGGVLRRCLVVEGETLQVGALVGVIAPADIDDTAIDAFIKGFEPAGTSAAQGDRVSAVVTAQKESSLKSSDVAETAEKAYLRKIRISPIAKRRAQELGIDISRVRANDRRITLEDVERYAQESAKSEIEDSNSAAYEAVQLSAVRKSIARKLTEAKQQIPHFYLSIDVNMDAALGRRAEINAQSSQNNLSVNDIVLRSVVMALQSVPDINIHFVRDEIHRFKQVNIALAVSTDKGIITPVIKNAEVLTILELARHSAVLVDRARSASLARADIEGGTFTISNLGMHGISEFQAVINPPQGAILALGKCEERVISTSNAIRTATFMRATLSCDHRAIDGMLGAQFLSALQKILEDVTEL